jgi:hypothetical protein
MLSKAIEVIKQNPWKTLIGSISAGTIIFTIVGTLFSEMRYTTNEAFEKHKIENSVVIRELQKQITELSKKQDK